MAVNATINERLVSPDLLLENLVRVINFILDVSVFRQSVFFFVSGLNQLHSRVKAIIRHGAKIKHHLIFSQESYAAFDEWLENSLVDHTLRLQLKESREKIKEHYHGWAFLRDDELFRGLIDSLYALSTRDLEYLVATCPSKRLKLAPPGYKLCAFEMPLNGNPVLSSCKLENDGLRTTVIIPKKKPAAGSPIEIPERKQSLVRHDSGLGGTDESVPEFSYPQEESPVVTDGHFPSAKSLTSGSGSFESYSFGRRSVEGNGGGATKSFLESGGLIQPPALGHFPLPQKGQSLTSFLSSLSTTMPELDRENAHFNVSEALISAFEKLKVKEKTEKMKEEERLASQEAMFESPYDLGRRRKQFQTRSTSRIFTATETEDSEIESWKQSPRRPPYMKKRRRCLDKLGSDGRSESYLSATEATTSLSPSPASSDEDEAISSFSAESVALNLLRNSRVKNVSDASELHWMVTESEAPQSLLPLPKYWNSASESESDCGALDKSMRLRGTSDWAPPRPQIIFTIHPPPNLHSLMEFQKYRCAGCGMKVETKYAGTFRYCNYLGRYFCTGCHTLKKARLPQMILHRWDFSPYLVSNFSATLLESLQSDPVYNVMDINPNLLRKVRLNNFRNYRIQLGYLAEYVHNCKAASSLREELEKFPSYYAADVDLYSLQDLVELRFSMGFPLKTKEFITKAISHILHCELCKQLGFVCEICKKDEVIFPFQLNRVVRCMKCLSCFHLRCFNPGKTRCPKCQRLSARSQEHLMGAVVA